VAGRGGEVGQEARLFPGEERQALDRKPVDRRELSRLCWRAHREARIHRSGTALFGTFRVTGIDHAGKPFDRYGIDLYEVRDGKIALKDSYLKAD
jgi:ketosteroid isomerase-like protein